MTDIAAWVRSQAGPETIAYETDPQYCSREAPLVILAGNTLFRVHAWDMLIFCGFFRAMAVDCNGVLGAVGPIPSDVNPAALRHFLEIIHTGQHSQWSIPLSPFDPDPVPLIECRSLARRWDCFLVEGIAQRALSARIRLDAWYMFKFASQLEDEQLGRECVAGFTLVSVPVEIYLWGPKIKSELFLGLSDAFLIELYFVVPIGNGADPWGTKPDWVEMSKLMFA